MFRHLLQLGLGSCSEERLVANGSHFASNAFQEDSDVEWKFARSLLYMEYIAEGGTLPPPLNIIGAPKAVLRALLCRCDCKGDGEGDQGQPDTNGTREQRNAIPLDETAASREGLSLEESSGVSLTFLQVLEVFTASRCCPQL